MVPAALISLNHTNDTYSMFNQYPQKTTQQPRTDSKPVFSPLRTIDKKRNGLHFFKEITYRTDEWTKQWLQLKIWVISGNPEQWMEFHRLWWTVSAFKCSYLFQLFDFFCLVVQYFAVVLKIYVLFLFFDDFEWKVKVQWKLLCKVTIP